MPLAEAAVMAYSDIFLEHLEHPRNVGWLKEHDAAGTIGAPGRPPFMAMSFRFVDGVVGEVKYRTFGCGPAIAAGSLLTEMVLGRSVEQCLALEEEQLIDTLGDIPSDKTWCVELALSTMRKALDSYLAGDRTAVGQTAANPKESQGHDQGTQAG